MHETNIDVKNFVLENTYSIPLVSQVSGVCRASSAEPQLHVVQYTQLITCSLYCQSPLSLYRSWLRSMCPHVEKRKLYEWQNHHYTIYRHFWLTSRRLLVTFSILTESNFTRFTDRRSLPRHASHTTHQYMCILKKIPLTTMELAVMQCRSRETREGNVRLHVHAIHWNSVKMKYRY